MYKCMKFSLRNLNPGFSSAYPTNTYTCCVIIALRVCRVTSLTNIISYNVEHK